MNRLQETLVDPAERATRAAGDHFERLRDRARAAMRDLLTDRERLDLAYADQREALTGEADPIMRAEFERRAERRYRTASAGIDAEGLRIPELPRLIDLDADGSIGRLNDTWKDIQDRIKASRDDFADAFSYGIESALRGDWRGLLESIFGSTLQDALRNVGRALFDSLGGGKPSGLNFGNIGSSISSIFSKLPKFQHQGTIKAGGAGGIDSQLVAFWKSPSEQVDVFDPRRGLAPAGGAVLNFDNRGAVMTADLLDQMQGMASQSGGNALRGARTAVPADRARSDKYRLTRR